MLLCPQSETLYQVKMQQTWSLLWVPTPSSGQHTMFDCNHQSPSPGSGALLGLRVLGVGDLSKEVILVFVYEALGSWQLSPRGEGDGCC